MATPYSSLYSLFLVANQDYKIDQLAGVSTASTPLMENYLEGFLMLAIPEFYNCQKNLDSRDDVLKTFSEDLTLEEQKILVNWMTYHWFLREVHDVTQINNLLSDTDFKMFSNANNLREKSAYANCLRETYMQRTVDYGIKNIPWENWASGEYV